MNELPLEPGDNEVTARFLVQSGHLAKSRGRVKVQAFQPATRDLKTSVFRILGLSERAVWELGDVNVARPRKKALLGRADVKVGFIRSIGLQLEADNEPIRHASIVAWPAAKDERKSLAQELAAEAHLVVDSHKVVEAEP